MSFDTNDFYETPAVFRDAKVLFHRMAVVGVGNHDDQSSRFLVVASCYAFLILHWTTTVVSFRALKRSDFPLLQRWLAEPHVDAWWHEALDLAGLEHKYGPRIDGIEPTHVFIIEHESRPIGWIQWYRWSDYPKHAAKLEAEPNAAGIDLSIGEVSLIGKGIGSSAIREFVLNVVSAGPGITAVVTDPEERNARSCRAFAKAGFVPMRTVDLEGENVRRRIMRLSLPALSQPLNDR